MNGELPSRSEFDAAHRRQDAGRLETLYRAIRRRYGSSLGRSVREPNTLPRISLRSVSARLDAADQWNGMAPCAPGCSGSRTNLASTISLGQTSPGAPSELPSDPPMSTKPRPYPLLAGDTTTLRPEEALEQAELRQRLVRLVNDLPGGQTPGLPHGLRGRHGRRAKSQPRSASPKETVRSRPPLRRKHPPRLGT